MNRWDGIYQVLPPRGDCPREKLSSGTCSRHAPSPNRYLEEQGRIKNQTLFWDTALCDAEVDGNCAEAATPVADVAQPRLLHEARQLVRRDEALDRLCQIRVGGAVAGDQRAEQRHQATEVEPEQCVPARHSRPRDLERDHQSA